MIKNAQTTGKIPEGSIAIATLLNGGWKNIELNGKRNAQKKATIELSTAQRNVLAHVKSCSIDTRILILLLLERAESGATELQDSLYQLGKKVSQPNVSHHMEHLLTTGVVARGHDGKRRPCRLTDVGRELLASVRSIVISVSGRENALILDSGDLFEEVGMCTGIAKSLADVTRMKIIQCLQFEEQSVGVICEQLSLSQPNVSHHLKVMSKENLLVFDRRGKHNYYSLSEKGRSQLQLLLSMER